MNDNLVITIGRQSGSGGRAIGQMLAEEMGIKCYDKELLTLAAKESGLCEELFHSNDEKPTNSFLYSLVLDTYSLGYSTSAYMDMPINHKIFWLSLIRSKGSHSRILCIIGRCADYALADNPNVTNVFIRGDNEDRIKRLMEIHQLDAAKAKEYMNKTDKGRSSYYNYYSNKRWEDSRSYDLCINSSAIGIEGCVKFIREFAEKKYASKKGTQTNTDR